MAQEREGVVGKRKLQDLAAEICPRQVLDEDTEEVKYDMCALYRVYYFLPPVAYAVSR